jgi:AcrR family transcriptional regulator
MTTTKERIVEAALQTIKEDGFAGTSARAIARRGGFNQALIFYHFGTLTDHLLAALDRTSDMRMAAYRERVVHITDLPSAVRVGAELYREDLESGHITVLTEMITGSLDRPDLGPQIVQRMQPWIAFTTDAVESLLASTGLSGLAPARTIAYAIVALWLGVDLMSHLEQDHANVEDLIDVASRLASLFPVAGVAR